MNMVMKKEWSCPQAVVETFAANEYVAGCWGVACNINAANQYDYDKKKYGVEHQADHCGLMTNQVLHDDDNDGIIDRMVEVGTEGLGTLECIVYKDKWYKQKRKIGTVQSGEYIYWTTSAEDGRTWHHQGTVEPIGSNPNFS